jgi:alanine racemase
MLFPQISDTCQNSLKVDTGMGRFGVFPEEIPSLAEAAMATGCIQIEGIYSHYANIDDDPDSPLNVIQKERFEKSLDLLRSINIYPAKIHCSNSAAAFNTPSSRYNLVRIGCALLGVNPFYYEPFPSYLQRALVWKTRLVSVRNYLPDMESVMDNIFILLKIPGLE